MVSLAELKKLAKERGLKTSQSKKQLADALGVSLPQPLKVILKGPNGEVLKYHSVYKAAKDLNVNQGIFYNYTKKVQAGHICYKVIFLRTECHTVGDLRLLAKQNRLKYYGSSSKGEMEKALKF